MLEGRRPRRKVAAKALAMKRDPLGVDILTSRYPYFTQQWAHDSWNAAKGPAITKADLAAATVTSICNLDESFFKVRLDRCTPGEKKYMRALAELSSGSHRSSDIAELLGVKINSVAPTRNALTKKGMIYSPSYGDTAFKAPLFDEFMRRAMPEPNHGS